MSPLFLWGNIHLTSQWNPFWWKCKMVQYLKHTHHDRDSTWHPQYAAPSDTQSHTATCTVHDTHSDTYKACNVGDVVHSHTSTWICAECVRRIHVNPGGSLWKLGPSVSTPCVTALFVTSQMTNDVRGSLWMCKGTVCLPHYKFNLPST